MLHCDCGFEARSEHEDELVAEVQRHAHEAHGMTLTQDEARRLVFRAEPEAGARSTAPRKATSRTKEEK